MKSFLYKLSLVVVPFLYSLLSLLLFSSCRVREYGREYYDQAKNRGPFIAAVWHYSVFFAINRMKDKGWVAMVSGSKDAEYISALLNRMGIITVRGSRGKGGLKAIKEMMVLMGEKLKNAAIIADGSQGPARKVQAGAILLASKTGNPILPVAWSMDRYKAFRSWDRTILPAPFGRVVVWYGKPIHVPSSIKAVDIEKYRLELEVQLNEIYSNAWEKFGKESHDAL